MSENSTATAWRAALGDGRAWVWLADGIGLALLVSLLSAAAPAGAIAVWLPWIVLAAALGCVCLMPGEPAGGQAAEAGAEPDRVPEVVTITITPRPAAARARTGPD